mgnify:CR=1 FL=1
MIHRLRNPISEFLGVFGQKWHFWVLLEIFIVQLFNEMTEQLAATTSKPKVEGFDRFWDPVGLESARAGLNFLYKSAKFSKIVYNFT